MTEDTTTPMRHPDELLAGYVDGSASAEDRHAVEAHVADCSLCRDEIALATRARAALTTLPELEEPGLAAQGLPGLIPAGAGDELRARREARHAEARGLRQWRISWAAVAGAAALVAVLAVVPFVLSRGGGDLQTAGSSPQPERGAAAPGLAERYPQVVDLGSNYDGDGLRALAEQFGDRARGDSGKESTTEAPGLSGGTPAALADVTSADVVACVLQGTGLPAETIPTYLEAATFNGTPAYVAVVQSEGARREHLRVYAVSREDCTFLFLADQPI